MFKNLGAYLRLTRFHQSTGLWLLMLPAFCGAFLATNWPSLRTLILLALGSFFIRSAGCIINDIVDKDFDKHVVRTKNRPLASRELTVSQAIWCLALLLLSAFIVLLNFNKLAIIIGFLALIPIIIYPHMKKYTYYPQLFLGFTFNLGAILSYAAICNKIDINIILFYVACVFWTLGYDTIYAYQDIADDKKIGVKSSAIRLSNAPKFYLTIFYFMFISLTAFTLILNNVTYQKLLFLLIPSSHIYWQLRKFNPRDPKICGEIFRSNAFTGLLLLLAIILIKL